MSQYYNQKSAPYSQYSKLCVNSSKYLKYPDYIGYINDININLKKPPYYTENQEKKMCIMYNYIEPIMPYVKPKCIINPRYEYWLTSQE